MSTTSQFQIKPDFFPSSQACVDSERKNINTNIRYKFFNQTHFTAGDIEQFEAYRDPSNGRVVTQDISMEKNVFCNINLPNVDWEKYRKLDPLSVTNTFAYMFHKFKKGIFVKIKNGKLGVFLPFSKKNFTNEWHHKIQVDPKYENISSFLKQIQTTEGRKFNPNSVNKFVDSWYANNCLLRWEFPIHEGDTNIPNASDMFKTLCEERELPDMEFFVNRRDFPMLKKDGTEPYDHLFGDNTPLLSHSYSKYTPILSMVGAEGYADIPIPTGDDWAKVTRKEGKFFPRTATRDFNITQTPWNKRTPIAVFRGASTGCGVTIETNVRLKLAYLSSITPLDSDGLPFLDAGITEWNLRPRKIKGEKYLQTIDVKNIPFNLVNTLSPQQQSTFKYVINVDGHVAAYRLTLELEFGCCILLASSKYKLWYRDMLQPFVHYIPVKADLSDLIDKIRWCKANDEKCKKIAENALKFAKTYLTKNGILDYLQKLLFDMKKMNGIYLYNSRPIKSILEERETQILHKDRIYPKTNKTIEDISFLPMYNRSYGFLKGIEWLVHMVNDNGKFSEIAVKKGEIFNNHTTLISEYELAGACMAEKTSTKSLVHEAFITTQGTNELLKQIPNFAYTFGFQDGIMITEYVSGETFNDYIHGKDFNMIDYVSILLQLGLALHVAQKKCGFVHYDLTPWNIIIQRLTEPATFDYVIDCSTVYRVRTKMIPIIIDMGRSHIITDNHHHGATNLFSNSTIQDIITILDVSIYEVSKLYLKNQAVKELITLANFLSNTGYRRKPFRESGKNGLGDIRYFFGKAKKYSEIISSDKCDLEGKTPIDLVKYIILNFKLGPRFTAQPCDELVYHMNHCNPRQVFDFALSSTIRERALTYACTLHRIQNMELPETPHLFQIYYTMQTITEGLHSLYEQMINYLDSEKIEDKEKFVKKYEKTVKNLDRKFRTLIKGKTETVSDIKMHYQTLIYNETTFLFPKKILELLKTHEKIDNIDDDILEIVEEIMLRKQSPYALLPEIRKHYKANFMKHISDRHKLRTYIANVTTLYDLVNEIYTSDMDEVRKKIQKEHGACPEADKYISVYREILEVINGS
jgi:hypothetical protein